MTILRAARIAVGWAWRRLPLDQGVRASLISLVPSHLRNPPRGSAAGTVRPAPARPGKDDYFIFGVIDWHYRIQRPQHLACEMVSAGHRVFYISSNLVADSRPGFRIEQLDEEGRLFQVFLNLKGARDVYHTLPSEDEQAQLNEGVRALLSWANSRTAIALIHHPFWSGAAWAIAGARVVYDCMDHHEGFGTFDQKMIDAERALIEHADLVVVSSAKLEDRVAPYAAARKLIRNGADFTHFSKRPESVYRDPNGRPILCYYGAIAPWLDVDLVAAIARRFADCLILLIGRDQVAAQRRLAEFANVKFTGEVAYADLPRYLHACDICVLPFLINDLTLATNPVKVYEYLSAGKPIVSVDLPEMTAFDGLVSSAPNQESFLEAIAVALATSPDSKAIARRKAFAANQTWAERGRCLMDVVAQLPGVESTVADLPNASAGVRAMPQ